MTISAVILTRNEEENIRGCLESINFCNEVVLVDDNSQDQTVKIARNLGAKVYKRDLDGDFAGQRNFGLTKAQGKWVLFLDADERVSLKLQKEILSAVRKDGVNGYYIKRLDYLWGKSLRYGEIGIVKIVRLAKKGKGEWVRNVHECWKIEKPLARLKNYIEHRPHSAVSSFISSINSFSSLHAIANKKEGKKSNPFKIIFFPFFKFIKGYFLQLGFLDGIQGFVVAIIMSFHSFLSWSKLWIKEKYSN